MIDSFLSDSTQQTLEQDLGTFSLRATAPEFVPQATPKIYSHNIGSYLDWRQIQLTDLFAHALCPLSDHLPLQARSLVLSGADLTGSTAYQLQASQAKIRATNSRPSISRKDSQEHIELDAEQKSFEPYSMPPRSTKLVDRDDKSQDGPLTQKVTPILRPVTPFSAQLDYIARQTLLLEGTDSINGIE